MTEPTVFGGRGEPARLAGLQAIIGSADSSNMTSLQHRQPLPSLRNKLPAVDTVSMNRSSYYQQNRSKFNSIDRRSKYNTLTPAEAKKIRGYLDIAASSHNAQPVSRYMQPAKTASVLQRPRPPPITVPDDLLYQPKSATTATGGSNNNYYENVNDRSASSCSNRRDQRHSINYGQFYANKHVLASNGNTFNGPMPASSSNNGSNSVRVSPSDSETNLSFRSSLDVMDSAYGSDRLQTLSVDLGNPHQQYQRPGKTSNCHLPNGGPYSIDSYSQESQNKLSDDSYASAKSYQSESKFKTLAKNSLSYSTSKVFQSQLGNLKKFLRYMPMRRSLMGNLAPSSSQQKPGPQINGQRDLSESISQLCLNRSQSPPVCPPPLPGELKSMTYMENSSVNYSNYDDFTSLRNQQSLLRMGYQQSKTDSKQEAQTTESNIDDGLDNSDSTSWHLQSLPLTYERNLTTVFEERNNSLVGNELNRQSSLKLKTSENNATNYVIGGKHFLEPPLRFEDNDKKNSLETLENHMISSDSSTSLTNAEPPLNYHRQRASSFRFSYAQPVSIIQVSLIIQF